MTTCGTRVPVMVGQFGLLQLHPVRTSLVNIARMQRAQNAAARIVLGLSHRDHARPALKELHWLLSHTVSSSLVMYFARTHSYNQFDPITCRQQSLASTALFI